MKKKDDKGAMLIFVLLISSVIISSGAALLSTTVMNYKMKITNSRVKRAFYNAEGALEEAYIIAEDFIKDALDYAISRGCSKTAFCDFLLGQCSDMPDQKSLVENLEDKANYNIYKENNTFIEAALSAKTNSYELQVTSHCVDDRIEKKLRLVCTVRVPDDNFSPDTADIENLLCVDSWASVRRIAE